MRASLKSGTIDLATGFDSLDRDPDSYGTLSGAPRTALPSSGSRRRTCPARAELVAAQFDTGAEAAEERDGPVASGVPPVPMGVWR
jgi:hypothetical protein